MISDPATWVDAHGDRLYRYALSRIRDERAAEDLVQDALVAAFKAREKFAGKSAELTWINDPIRGVHMKALRARCGRRNIRGYV